jgi:hypothetical protein
LGWLWVLLCRFLARSGVVLLFTEGSKSKRCSPQTTVFTDVFRSIFGISLLCLTRECWKLFFLSLLAHNSVVLYVLVLEYILNAKISCVSLNALIKLFASCSYPLEYHQVLDLCEPWKQG